MGSCGVNTWGVLGAPGSGKGQSFVRISQQLVGRLPTGVMKAYCRNCVPLMPFDRLICQFPDFFLPLNCGDSCLNTLGVVGEKWISPVVSCTAGLAEALLTTFSFLCRRGHCWLVRPWTMCHWGRDGTGRYSYPLQCI